ncbi:hypothetical protein KA037_06790 [Patescibacteria group bacterium]|nr:hypothetical protein [Patescibacteria group bacterium]
MHTFSCKFHKQPYLYTRFTNDIIDMDMKQLILQFPTQLEDALQIAQQAQLHPHTSEIHHVVIA